MFSRITSKLYAETNALYKLRDKLKAQGHSIIDLVSGNLNEQGFFYPQDVLEEILVRASRKCLVYQPNSLGQRPAREAISEYYRQRGHDIKPDWVLITPGTSFSYWYCFKLLADEGDEILCPCPSYPLFDYIALLSGVRLIYYRLDEKRNWSIDIDHLESQISTGTRAVVLISPHNPTGHVASLAEIDALAEVARRHELAIISDEVFSEFLLEQESLPRPMGSKAPIVFTLNGFSKMFALPGLKFGWMTISGDPDKISRALRALELISDTFLPVNEIIQAAAPEILGCSHVVREQFASRVRACWECAERLLSTSPHTSYVKPQGGFYVTLRLKDIDEERAAQAILQKQHLLVHPGYFYDMDPDHLVLSFVQPPHKMQTLVPKLLMVLEEQSLHAANQTDDHLNQKQ